MFVYNTYPSMNALTQRTNRTPVSLTLVSTRIQNKYAGATILLASAYLCNRIAQVYDYREHLQTAQQISIISSARMCRYDSSLILKCTLKKLICVGSFHTFRKQYLMSSERSLDYVWSKFSYFCFLSFFVIK